MSAMRVASSAGSAAKNGRRRSDDMPAVSRHTRLTSS